MVIKCSIKFDQDNNRSYHAGELVSGNVTIQCHKPITVRGITLKICGYAKIKCSAACAAPNKCPYCMYFAPREDYIDVTKYLVGFRRANDEIKVEPSVENYKFEFTIPENCPSSFESGRGRIKFCVKVIIARPWLVDKVYDAPFNVLNKLDLNKKSRMLRLPANQDVVKQFSCHPCRTLPLTLSVFIPQSGYVPGQFITVTLKLNNPTNVQIREIRISLILIANLSATQKYTSTDTISLTSKTVVSLPNKCQNMFSELIRVPPTPPSCEELSKIIKISHVLQVEAIPAGLHTNATACIPITIGTLGLTDSRDGRAQPVAYQNEMHEGRENLI